MKIPKHIGFIMDGNGRWATERGLPRSAGHKAGFEKIPEVLKTCRELGIHIVSGYAWSTENWTRPKPEVDYIMQSLEKHLPRFVDELHKQNVRFIHSGSREKMSARALEVIDNAISLTKDNGPWTFNFLFNYGGRAELLHATKQIINSEINPKNISESLVEKSLWSEDLPGVDLLVRTGGDRRISNFMLWQTANTSLYFINSYWPAITKKDIEKGIAHYNHADIKTN